jgi:hypothetical protein
MQNFGGMTKKHWESLEIDGGNIITILVTIDGVWIGNRIY